MSFSDCLPVYLYVNFPHFVLLQNTWANFNNTLHKKTMCEKFQVCLNEGPYAFPRVDNKKSENKFIDNMPFKISPRNMGPIPTQLGLKDPCVLGNNNLIVKNYKQHFKIFFSRTTWLLSTMQPWHKASLGEGNTYLFRIVKILWLPYFYDNFLFQNHLATNWHKTVLWKGS